jgi:hypothetical protein
MIQRAEVVIRANFFDPWVIWIHTIAIFEVWRSAIAIHVF